MRRFERIYEFVEPVEEYRLGGYHPVHLHDLFNQRYEVVAKLGYGEFSTVWLARDRKLRRHVALKILKADASNQSNELSVLHHLSVPGLEHPGQRHVMQLLDHFEHHGPNGTHICLILPMMMSDGWEMTIQGEPRQASYVRTISTQILLGLDFLHKRGIIHSDLQPANILFSVNGTELSDISLNPPEYSPVNWLQGVDVDDSAPKYLITSQRRRGMLDNADSSTLLVKIGDMGGAIWNGQSDQRPVTPTGLRAPELIHGDPWDASIDIWILGCLIFELATNEPLFPVETFGLNREQIDDVHEKLLHHIDDDNYFTVYLSERLPSDFGNKNIRQFASFLLSMLRRLPQERKTTTDLLSHGFLQTE
ncbi:kinase-like domain-containing protein [Lipomyces tetrasporus]|uniref:non-specific serine/threonine protein kinase n=1 Tax=Lipomyces tetrasporus TaxID=54092 RepID=A0AAD7QP23_9ASCO|nr:kinase-like domain-containing protein [Lipomyces tetrasporus]KAJ8098869.1 kinase-like domain-containing protein [Lipomyces tetrasporus]